MEPCQRLKKKYKNEKKKILIIRKLVSWTNKIDNINPTNIY